MYTLNENINTQSHIEDIEDLEVSISSSWYQIHDYATKFCVQIVSTSYIAKPNKNENISYKCNLPSINEFALISYWMSWYSKANF